MNLQNKIDKISGVGATVAKRLIRLGLHTVEDLLFYFPYRYNDYSQITPINNLQIGANVNILGDIELIQNKRSSVQRMNITEALIADESGQIKVIWFNQPFIAKNLKTGDRVSLTGQISSDYGGLVMKSPDYEKIFNKQSGFQTQGIVPDYHLTANITQKQIRFLIKKIISFAAQIIDHLPDEIRNKESLLSLDEALSQIHFPVSQEKLIQAKQRLSFDEVFLIQLQAQVMRNRISQHRAPKIKFQEKETKEFVSSLGFKLTNAQRITSWEILTDIGKAEPMSRLLEGDVGSGKTIVAVIAMLNVFLNQEQSILMVPTEILAQQHFLSISKILKNYPIKIALFTSKVKKIIDLENCSELSDEELKEKILVPSARDKKIQEEKIDIFIGTHALLYEDLELPKLALVVIDEQHRFGVEQRKKIIKKDAKIIPHLLSMTATPIPRSLALSICGDLDISIINEMPKSRKPIMTKIILENERDRTYDFIRAQIKEGRQVFVVCPLIEKSDKLGVKSVQAEFTKLKKDIFPEKEIALLHGRMKIKEKEEVMQNFLKNKINILVSTSVVEVGIDIPNASIMMIEGAERFGLAQLHQFRGRVGRGVHQSYCFLFPSDKMSPKTEERLAALVTYQDGFNLAKIDLKLRGPGEVYGTSQKGFPEFKLANIMDYELVRRAQESAKLLVQKDPSFDSYPELRKKFRELSDDVHLE